MKAHNPDNPSITHYTVDITQGNCTCPSFTHDHIPCKHMFAVFQLYPEWSWSNLPPVLLNAPHMTLEALPEDTPHDDPENTDTIAPDDTISMETNLSMPATVIPSASSRALQIYREQKKTIDIFSKASAIIHTIEDTELLKSVQHYGDILYNVLTNAATTSAMPGDIPAVTQLVQAGTTLNRQQSKFHRKRKRACASTSQPPSKRAKTISIDLLKLQKPTKSSITCVCMCVLITSISYNFYTFPNL